MTYNKKNLFSYSLFAVAFLLPFNHSIVNYSIALSIVLFLINFRFNEKQKVFQPWFFLPVSYYLLHVIGCFYSDNLRYAFNDLQTKFSFILFPLMIYFSSLSKEQSQKIKFYFIFGCFIASAFNIISALRYFNFNNDIGEFYYIRFSRMMHPTYFTMYLNLSIIFLIDSMFIPIYQKANRWRFFMMLFFFLNIILLSSRMALLTTYLTVLIFIILKLKTDLKLLRFWPVIAMTMFVVFVANFFILKQFNRFKQVSEFLNEDEHSYNDVFNSTTLRAALWTNARELISQHKYFGVGTGDIKEELVKVYHKNNFVYAESERFSPHNQILHTAVILGITGALLLILMLFVPLIISIRLKSFAFMCFLFMIVINMQTESILERQAGVIFFVFFYALIFKECVEKNQSSKI